jgi:hypothetical protein
MIDEAISIADQGSGLTLIPEFYRLKGELLHAASGANGAGAEPWLRRAFEVAAELDARMPQLRAAIGLYRSRREQGDAEHRGGVLRAVYATFTEGFTAPDLVDAGNLLETVPESVGGRRPAG